MSKLHKLRAVFTKRIMLHLYFALMANISHFCQIWVNNCIKNLCLLVIGMFITWHMNHMVCSKIEDQQWQFTFRSLNGRSLSATIKAYNRWRGQETVMFNLNIAMDMNENQRSIQINYWIFVSINTPKLRPQPGSIFESNIIYLLMYFVLLW